MKRRNFLSAAAITTAAIPSSFALANTPHNQAVEDKELYEIRTYELRLGGNLQMLTSYLNDVLQPALKRKGVNRFMMFYELENSDPRKLWVLIGYPGALVYLQSQNLSSDKAYMSASEAYRSIPVGKAIYERIESSLLLAFDGLPKMLDPVEGATLFELRTYEGYSEDAVSRKIRMFNAGELDVFYKTQLNPVFFGEMIAGPYRPCLTYMINFKDMEEHDRNWDAFRKHPDWKAMSGDPQFANTVSKIRKVFLKPVNY